MKCNIAENPDQWSGTSLFPFGIETLENHEMPYDQLFDNALG
jgi:hypothetical protein